MKSLEEYVLTIPDFPKPGIMFRDLTSVLADADGFHLAIDTLKKMLEGVDFDVVVGPEARGFILGSPLPMNSESPLFPFAKRASSLATSSVRNTILNTARPKSKCTPIP